MSSFLEVTCDSRSNIQQAKFSGAAGTVMDEELKHPEDGKALIHN